MINHQLGEHNHNITASPLETHQHSPSCAPMAASLAQIAEVLIRIWILLMGITISAICYFAAAIWKMFQ